MLITTRRSLTAVREPMPTMTYFEELRDSAASLCTEESRAPWEERCHFASHVENFLFRKVYAELSTGHHHR